LSSIEELMESELIYRNLLETVDVGFYQVTLDGQMLNHNRAHNIILGYESSESLQSKDVRQFWQNPEDREHYIQYLLEHKFTKNYICHALKKNGEKIIVELNSHLIQDGEGNPIRIDGTFIDITEKFNLEQKLKESEKKFRKIFEAIPDLYFLISEDTTILDYKGQEQGWYINPDSFMRKKIVEILPQDIGRKTIELVQKTILTKEPHTLDYELKINDKIIFFEARHFYFSKNRVFIFIRDMTERKTMEKKIRESEESYRDLYEGAPNAYFSIGCDKFIIKCNRVAEKLSGYTKDELLKMRFLDLYANTEHGVEKAQKIFQRFLNGESIQDEELQLKKRNGENIWVSLSVTPILDQSGKVIEARSIVLDINKRKLAEKALKNSEKKYREAFDRANFYKDLFTHDINNILQIINSSAELISYHLGDSEKSKTIKDIAKVINQQIDRGAKLVTNVRTLSELEAHEVILYPINLCELLTNSINFIKQAFENTDLKIQIESSGQEIIVQANELLQSVFENVLINSIKYNETKNVDIAIKISELHLNSKNYIKIEFLDNGIGVPDDRKEIIFKRGHRRVKDSKGMGLGLSLVKEILKSLNGKIWVEDKVKGDYTKGSNFVLLIPE